MFLDLSLFLGEHKTSRDFCFILAYQSHALRKERFNHKLAMIFLIKAYAVLNEDSGLWF